LTGTMRPDGPMAYVAASIGGVVGVAVGIAGGWPVALALERPEAGMANLALLFIPFVFLLVAQPVGTFVALRFRRHPDAGPVAALTGAFTLALAAFVMSSAGRWFVGRWSFVVGLTLIMAAPALALYVRVRVAPRRSRP
jgi:hypothetical protein